MNTKSKNINKRRFNIADLIIIIIAAVILILMIKLFFGDVSFAANETFEAIYTVKLEKVNDDFIKHIATGFKVYEDSLGTEIGVIESTEIKKSIMYEYDSKSDFYRSYEYPDLNDITVTVKAKCNLKDSRYFINGFEIITGKNIAFRTKSMYADGVITSVGLTSPESLQESDRIPQ